MFWITKEPHRTDALILCYVMIRSNYYLFLRASDGGNPCSPGNADPPAPSLGRRAPPRDFCKNTAKPRLPAPRNTAVVPEGGDKILAFRGRGLTWLIN